jgi:hypothetical protein
VVFTEIDGVVNDVPVPSDTPPVDPAYQLIVPADAVAPNVTIPGPHTEPGVVPVIDRIVLTVARTEVLADVVHPFAVASI